MDRGGLLSPERFDATLDEFEASAREPEGERLPWQLHRLEREVVRQLVDSDLEGSTWLLARVDQFNHALRERVDGGADALWGSLAELADDIRAYIRRLERERSEARRERQAATLKGRILEVLGSRGRRRPSQLVEELGVSAPQISRALRQLAEEGLIEAVDHPYPDARAVWYALSETASVEDDTDEPASRVASVISHEFSRLGLREGTAAIVRVGSTELSVGGPKDVQRILDSGPPEAFETSDEAAE